MNLISKAMYLFDGGKMEALLDHVRRGDVDYIKTIDKKLLQKARDEDGNTVLMIATEKCYLHLCKEILKKCPSLLYHENNYNNTVLHEATDSFISRENFLFIDFFVSVGVDELATSNEGDIYMKFKRWMKMQDFKGDTALVIAARHGNLHVVKGFVEVDRKYNLGLSKVVGFQGKTALNWAVGYKDHEMVKLLTDKGDPYSDFVPYSTAMDLFDRIKGNDLDYVKTVEVHVLLNSRDKGRRSALHIATKCNRLDCCKEILKRCPVLLYHQSNNKWSVLHQAAYHKNYRLIDFYVCAGLEAAKSEGGMDNIIHFKKWINLLEKDGFTALILAVSGGSHDIVKRFVEVDRQYKLGLSKIVGYENKTALQWAMQLQFDEVIKTLAGSEDPDLSGAGAESKSNIFTFAEVSKHNNLKDHEMIKRLIDHVRNGDVDYIRTVDPNVLLRARDDKHGDSVLMVATNMGNLNLCKEILSKCPSLLYHVNIYNKTVLHEATDLFLKETVLCEKLMFIDLFVNAGLDEIALSNEEGTYIKFRRWMKMKKFNGDTALVAAARLGSLDVVKRFVEVDRRYNLGLSKVVGEEGKTALNRAEENEDPEMLKLLADEEDPYSDEGDSTVINLLNGAGALKSNEQHEMIKSLTGSRDPNLDYGANSDYGTFPISAAMQQAQDSLQTKNSSGTGVVSENNILTLAEVSKHNNLKDCRLLIDDKVIDVTKFLGDRPGGSKVMLKATGKDATTDFKISHSRSSSSSAVTKMDKFNVGVCDSITNSLHKLARDKPQTYSRAELKEFTKDFSQLIGSGGFGDVYKGQFPDDIFIAVKVLKNIEFKEKIMEEQFIAEVDTMGRAYHRNLIKLYGYCYESNTKFKALVYDFMENGSFDTILFEKKLDLQWAKLHNIAKEIAQGISYLHESCYPQIIHQDVKPSNVLLDSNLSPKVIDFGLAKVNMGESQFEQTKIKGSRDYMAPEVNQYKQVKLSCKLDVYSFGMMLFDILGSKRNHVDKSWFPGQVWEKYKTNQLDKFILDCDIREEDRENAKRLAIIALLCVEHNPRARPMLSNVVNMLGDDNKELDTPLTPFYPDYYSSESSSMSDSRDY